MVNKTRMVPFEVGQRMYLGIRPGTLNLKYAKKKKADCNAEINGERRMRKENEKKRQKMHPHFRNPYNREKQMVYCRLSLSRYCCNTRDSYNVTCVTIFYYFRERLRGRCLFSYNFYCHVVWFNRSRLPSAQEQRLKKFLFFSIQLKVHGWFVEKEVGVFFASIETFLQ